FARLDVRDVADPFPIRFGRLELPSKHVLRHRMRVLRVGRCRHVLLHGLRADFGPVHQFGDRVLTAFEAFGFEFLEDARRAVNAPAFGVYAPDLVEQFATALCACARSAPAPGVEAAVADLQYAAQRDDLELLPMGLDPGVLHRLSFAKYAVAFFKMSRSIVSRRFSRSSAATRFLRSSSSATPTEPLSLRWSLSQLSSVPTPMPKLPAACVRVYFCSITSATAERLNSGVNDRLPICQPSCQRLYAWLRGVSTVRGEGQSHDFT